jgi:hypothetical protein
VAVCATWLYKSVEAEGLYSNFGVSLEAMSRTIAEICARSTV